jgi:excisionase family DNA binding protein
MIRPRPDRRYGTIAEAAAITRFSDKTIRRMIADGKLTGYRLGRRHIRIDLDELDALMAPIPTTGDASSVAEK